MLLAEVTGFDLADRRVELRSVAEDVPTPASLEYDSLIVADGSHYSYFGHESSRWRGRSPRSRATAVANTAPTSTPPPSACCCGRLIVEADQTLPRHPDFLAIGDMITIRRDGKLKPLPGGAPVAMQQGRHAARVVLAKLRGQPTRPFHYHDKGKLATIGRARAV